MSLCKLTWPSRDQLSWPDLSYVGGFCKLSWLDRMQWNEIRWYPIRCRMNRSLERNGVTKIYSQSVLQTFILWRIRKRNHKQYFISHKFMPHIWIMFEASASSRDPIWVNWRILQALVTFSWSAFVTWSELFCELMQAHVTFSWPAFVTGSELCWRLLQALVTWSNAMKRNQMMSYQM